VHACEVVNIESIQAEQLGFIEYFLMSNCGKLLDLGANTAPSLFAYSILMSKPLILGLPYPLSAR